MLISHDDTKHRVKQKQLPHCKNTRSVLPVREKREEKNTALLHKEPPGGAGHSLMDWEELAGSCTTPKGK